MSRTKGHSFEREMARLFKAYFPEAKRGLQTRGGTAEAPDVEGTPFYIECKRMRRCNIRGALRQAEAGAYTVTGGGTFKRDPRPPIAICKNDREKAVVAIYLEDFMKMVERIYGK